jgi:hypothetical protein
MTTDPDVVPAWVHSVQHGITQALGPHRLIHPLPRKEHLEEIAGVRESPFAIGARYSSIL